jgi:hypothetical protein
LDIVNRPQPPSEFVNFSWAMDAGGSGKKN